MSSGLYPALLHGVPGLHPKSDSLDSLFHSSKMHSSPSSSSLESSSTAQSSLYLKIPDERETANGGSSNHWTRRERYIWFFTLLSGTTCVYAARTTMPLVSPKVAATLGWSKTEVGTVLSSFFWGYTLTQILGGYLSDRFGSERVLFASGLGWGLLTFWFHQIVYISSDHDSALSLIVLSRVLLGACQGVHFPAMASISARNLSQRDRSFFFSATMVGTAFGTLLTGTLGSFVNETFGWPSVFYTIGLVCLCWVAVLKYYAMEVNKQRRQVLGMSASVSLLGKDVPVATGAVPWLTYLRHPSLWAAIVCHFCQNNCFFILLSWLPTYFHDNFPGAQSWIFNVVPWILMVPGIAVASYVVNKMLVRGYSVGQTRKTAEIICMGTESVCLLLIGMTNSFPVALTLMSVCLFASTFHNVGVICNPQDLAPKHTGSVFGVVNAAGAMPGLTSSYESALFLVSLATFSNGFHKMGTVVNILDIAPKHSGSVYGLVNTAASTAGFIGVYLAGYILELTGSWSAVFNVTAVINLIGVSFFVLFGSGNPIL